MNNTSDNTKDYDLPRCSTMDPAAMEQLRRGLCQQADGLKRQLSGVQQQIHAIDRLKKSDS